jgi:biopolymer transport protein ExbB/TolQ
MARMANRSHVRDAVNRACTRASVAVHAQLSRGLRSLDNIVSVAPILGMIGTTIMMFSILVGWSGEKSQMLGTYNRILTISLVPLALGIAVFTLALSCRYYLRERLERLDFEMKDASMELLEILARF